MKAVFRSKDLWSIVEKGVAEEPDDNRLTEIMKKDAKAVCLIQQNLDDRVLLRITEAKTAKQAWDMLKTHYQGNTNNITIKMLREEFPYKTVVTKILRSLTPRFTNVVSSIVEAKDLNTLAIDALCGSLRSHESILNNAGDQDEDKALHVRTTPSCDHFNRGGRGRGRGGFNRGRGRGRGRGRNSDIFHHADNSRQHKNVQCFICKKFGHDKSQCWYRSKEANITEEAKEQDEGLLFMASTETRSEGVKWLINSGCSNHMSGDRRLFKNLESTPQHNIRLGDGNLLQVAGFSQ
ncbi:uncharacterized protein LOC120258749 [Dioscorea cayenensis subsp. rotundata]|uniref:Uncharacterized protein LOC120258749 n=1 Tax=Dioscorea cayennensis subsp. rotundata TaxID=55577 RepID=A0AB40B4P6_DIOCR|nr:uncharacterized protein LOC120258749 [Dioscorea cayenensis subsp. rotundata]